MMVSWYAKNGELMRDDSEVIRDESNDGEVMRDDGELICEESLTD